MSFEVDKYFNYVLLLWGPLALIAVYIAGSLYRTVKNVKAFHEEFEVLKDQLTYLADKIARLESQLIQKEQMQASGADAVKARSNSSSQPVRTSDVKNAETGSGIRKAAEKV